MNKENIYVDVNRLNYEERENKWKISLINFVKPSKDVKLKPGEVVGEGEVEEG